MGQTLKRAKKPIRVAKKPKVDFELLSEIQEVVINKLLNENLELRKDNNGLVDSNLALYDTIDDVEERALFRGFVTSVIITLIIILIIL